MALRAFWLAMNTLSSRAAACLNAPCGAPCFLTCTSTLSEALRPRLNAPYDALCFLMIKTIDPARPDVTGVNAPYGAPRFLTSRPGQRRWQAPDVLMHLMLLRAF